MTSINFTRAESELKNAVEPLIFDVCCAGCGKATRSTVTKRHRICYTCGQQLNITKQLGELTKALIEADGNVRKGEDDLDFARLPLRYESLAYKLVCDKTFSILSAREGVKSDAVSN